MALGNYAQAAKTAVIIARSEQELGNYKVCRILMLRLLMYLYSCLGRPQYFVRYIQEPGITQHQDSLRVEALIVGAALVRFGQSAR